MTFLKVEDRGVTASCLIDLMWVLSKKIGNVFMHGLLGLTSRDAEASLIEGVTRKYGCSFVDWLVDHWGEDAVDLIDSDYKYVHTRTLSGAPETFVSHSWNGKFRDLMYIPKSLGGQQGTISNHCYWIDLFAVNQHKARPELERIEHAIERCKRTALVLDEAAMAPTRIWCVFELWVTITANHPIDLVFASPNGAWTVLYALCILAGRCSNLDVRNAEATNAADKVEILARIESSGVGCDVVNATVRDALCHAARVEVSEKAHVPTDVSDEAVRLIRQIGWDNVLRNRSDAQSVLSLFFDHVRYRGK